MTGWPGGRALSTILPSLSVSCTTMPDMTHAAAARDTEATRTARNFIFFVGSERVGRVGRERAVMSRHEEEWECQLGAL
jgi:hypothetical protein